MGVDCRVHPRGGHPTGGRTEYFFLSAATLSTLRSPLLRMASQPPPGDGTPRTPSAPPSIPSARGCYYERQCVVLVDWWLERMDDNICIAGLMETPRMRREGVFSSLGNKKSAGRVFKDAIATVCDTITIETVNGYVVWLKGNVNKSRMSENGFSKEVYKSFKGGFPVQWKNILDGHSQAPSKHLDNALVQRYLDRFMSDSFLRSSEFSFEEYNICSFHKFASSNMGQPGTPKCSKSLVILETENPSKVSAARMTAPSGAVNEVRTLRSGRVLGGPISAPMRGGRKRKGERYKASNNRKLPNEAVSPTADLTSHENGCTAAGIVAEDKLRSNDSHSRGKLRKRRDRKGLFSNFM